MNWSVNVREAGRLAVQELVHDAAERPAVDGGAVLRVAERVAGLRSAREGEERGHAGTWEGPVCTVSHVKGAGQRVVRRALVFCRFSHSSGAKYSRVPARVGRAGDK